MTDAFSVSDEFIHDNTVLIPKNAVAVIIFNDKGHVLLQLGDDKPGIFFPNHWGFFGGAVDQNETPEACAQREIAEETGLSLDVSRLHQLPSVGLGFKLNSPLIWRFFFFAEVDKNEANSLQIHEGQKGRFFEPNDCLKIPNFTPYDRFALWAFLNQNRIEVSPNQ